MKQCELKTKPAFRALIRLNVYTLLDLGKISPESLVNAHGLGPTSLVKLEPFLTYSIVQF